MIRAAPALALCALCLLAGAAQAGAAVVDPRYGYGTDGTAGAGAAAGSWSSP